MPRKNLCTCPAAVDITFTGHLPDCPEWHRPVGRASPRAGSSEQLRIVRRQLTCARKQIRKLQAQRSPEVRRVVRWAKNYVRLGGPWSMAQLKRAVAALEKLPTARLNDLLA